MKRIVNDPDAFVGDALDKIRRLVLWQWSAVEVWSFRASASKR